MDELVCERCGGALGSDYVCPYCGTRYRPPETQQSVINNTTTYNITITNVSDGFDLPSEAVQAPEVESESESVLPAAPEQPEHYEGPDIDESSEQPDVSFATRLANGSTLLFFCALLGLPVCLYLWRKTGNDWWAIGAVAAGVIVWFVHRFYKGGKD